MVVTLSPPHDGEDHQRPTSLRSRSHVVRRLAAVTEDPEPLARGQELLRHLVAGVRRGRLTGIALRVPHIEVDLAVEHSARLVDFRLRYLGGGLPTGGLR